jgi:hypothetical protein
MNMSYQQYRLHRLATVNGVDIKNLRHLANVYKSLKDSNNGVQGDSNGLCNDIDSGGNSTTNNYNDSVSNNERSNETIISSSSSSSSSNSNNISIINTTTITTTTTNIIDNNTPSTPTTPTTPAPTTMDGYIELDFTVQKGLDMRNIAVFDIKEIQDTELEILKTHKVPHWCSLELLV